MVMTAVPPAAAYQSHQQSYNKERQEYPEEYYRNTGNTGSQSSKPNTAAMIATINNAITSPILTSFISNG